MQRVLLPPGCVGFNCKDGTKYVTKPGKSVYIEDHHAKALKNDNDYVSQGLISAGDRHALGTKKGQYCSSCRRLWQVWSKVCPRCGEDTVPEV